MAIKTFFAVDFSAHGRACVDKAVNPPRMGYEIRTFPSMRERDAFVGEDTYKRAAIISKKISCFVDDSGMNNYYITPHNARKAGIYY